ncbi:MAG TPA: hypothetical protein VMW38_18065 [Terriglobia bacterium]|nr:hypothetical protein [Terriglobia bacterium]
MDKIMSFGEILEAADQMAQEDQETLIEVLKSRLRDRHRAEQVRAVQEAQAEYRRGECRPATPDELMGEILS